MNYVYFLQNIKKCYQLKRMRVKLNSLEENFKYSVTKFFQKLVKNSVVEQPRSSEQS